MGVFRQTERKSKSSSDMDLGDQVFACGFASKLENAAPDKSKRQEQVLSYGDKVFACGEDSHPFACQASLAIYGG